MDDVLLYLLLKDCHIRPEHVKTTEISRYIGITQQAVSHRIKVLEKRGYIERADNRIMITDSGINMLKKYYTLLKKKFNPEKIIIKGNVISGTGEGKKYVRIYKKRISLLVGFLPYEGTLNIKLKNTEIRKRMVATKQPIIVAGFKEKGREYGELFIYRGKIDKIPCAIVIPMKTRHPYNVLEIISPVNLREKLKLKDRDTVNVTVL